MVEIHFRQATRIYPGTDAPAVDAFDLDIAAGEFMVLVGPSGSGKTTALRMLAGLEEVDAGAIYIGESRRHRPVGQDRDLAMVFRELRSTRTTVARTSASRSGCARRRPSASGA
jgi:multiple sugar transport system ATP-binding protein